jgi:hypothetical protein
MVLNMAQTWHQVRPGEIRTDCGGCHAHSQKPTRFADTLAARADYPVWDLTGKTPLLTTKKHDESGKRWDTDDSTGVHWVEGIKNVEYYRDVKPILERSCAACHTGKSEHPPAKLVLDDDSLVQGPGSIAGLASGPSGKVPGTFLRLALDPRGKFGHASPITSHGWSHPQASRYVRYFQSRRSLLVWKIFGKRLDGWKDDEFATEAVPGDANSLVYLGKPLANTPQNQSLINLTYHGSIMPPPEAVAGTYKGPDGKQIKVAPLTDEDRLTLVRWIDLGCPLDLAYDPARPQFAAPNSWMQDDNRPALTLTYPQPGANRPLTRVLFGMHDVASGLDLDTLQVAADFTVEGAPAGANLAGKFKALPDSRWELTLSSPISKLSKGKMTVSVKDRQGNLTRIERVFSVTER